MRKIQPANVLIAIGTEGTSGRECLSGILDYVNTGRHWKLTIANDHLSISANAHLVTSKQFNGIITEYPLIKPFLKEIANGRTPVVFVDHIGKSKSLRCPHAFLGLDDEAIGDAAARYFNELGVFGSYLFVSDRDPLERQWVNQRLNGFRKALAERSKVPSFVKLDASETGLDETIASELKSLPMPIAVFAGRDLAAARILDICKLQKFSVPDQVSVLGVDNDELICNGSHPTISSIQPNHHLLGYESAKALNGLLKGGKSGISIIRKSIIRLVPRESSRAAYPAEYLIRKAREFIHEHRTEAITPAKVVTHLGVSRSLADLRFRTLLGKSLGQTIQEERTAAATHLLVKTDMPIMRVASLCGFPSSATFIHFFKHATGLSPLQWRMKNRIT